MENVVDADERRVRIGHEFVRQFELEASKISNVRFLAQVRQNSNHFILYFTQKKTNQNQKGNSLSWCDWKWKWWIYNQSKLICILVLFVSFFLLTKIDFSVIIMLVVCLNEWNWSCWKHFEHSSKMKFVQLQENNSRYLMIVFVLKKSNLNSFQSFFLLLLL